MATQYTQYKQAGGREAAFGCWDANSSPAKDMDVGLFCDSCAV
jgi:hypothetical protein